MVSPDTRSSYQARAGGPVFHAQLTALSPGPKPRHAARSVGAHDRIIAATALVAGWRVATSNVRHFENIAGLDVLGIDLA